MVTGVLEKMAAFIAGAQIDVWKSEPDKDKKTWI